jgi:hypothetical protein
MEKLNTQKEPMIEIFRLVEKRMMEKFSKRTLGVTVVNFSVYFYIQDDEVKGNVYFETIGHLK